MSLKVPCKYCGKEISLRKMPNGQFVPFDKGTNTHHCCQDQTAKTKGKNCENAKPQVYVSAGTSVGDLVLRVISESPGIKARTIAAIISKKYGVNVDRSEVNRWLYHDLKGKVYQDGAYQWFLTNTQPQKGARGAENNTDGASNQVQVPPPERKTEPISTSGTGVQQDTNNLLWAAIMLLVIFVLVLLEK